MGLMTLSIEAPLRPIGSLAVLVVADQLSFSKIGLLSYRWVRPRLPLNRLLYSPCITPRCEKVLWFVVARLGFSKRTVMKNS